MKDDNAPEAVRLTLQQLTQLKKQLAREITRLKKLGVSYAVADWRNGERGNYLYLIPPDNTPPEYIGSEPDDQQRALDKIARGKELTELRKKLETIDQQIQEHQQQLDPSDSPQ